jgi:AcrR family transcriptional regulator
MRGMVSSKRHLFNQPLLRSHILDAARTIVVRQGFDALSMRKLAEVIGYSPASLYLHFASRDAIAHALSVEGHAMLLAELHACDSVADTGARVKAMAHAYVAFGLTHPEVYRLIFMQNPAYADAAFGDIGRLARPCFPCSITHWRRPGRQPRPKPCGPRCMASSR